jgi:hypothetical protein
MEEITRVVKHCVSVIVLGVQVNCSWKMISFGKRGAMCLNFTFQLQETVKHDFQVDGVTDKQLFNMLSKH